MWTELELFPRPPAPASAVMVSLRWTAEDGWTGIACCHGQPDPVWTKTTFRGGSALTDDELVTLVATLLTVALERRSAKLVLPPSLGA